VCSQEYGHRVRLASHANFKDFVKIAGLEYYPLGGDPKVLAGCTSLLIPESALTFLHVSLGVTFLTGLIV
jgi:hypothetical protein